mgnify:CR=1 FL=1
MADGATTTPQIYAGIGSRATPPAERDRMRAIAANLAREGWILRSGGANGADAAFEEGALAAGGRAEIFLPWAGFNGHPDGIAADRLAIRGEAERIAATFHPGWERLRRPVRALMTRNVHQILGRGLDTPAHMVVCWAPGTRCDLSGRILDVAGGTGQAVRVAYRYGIEVFNLALPEHAERIQAWLERT